MPRHHLGACPATTWGHAPLPFGDMPRYHLGACLATIWGFWGYAPLSLGACPATIWGFWGYAPLPLRCMRRYHLGACVPLPLRGVPHYHLGACTAIIYGHGALPLRGMENDGYA